MEDELIELENSIKDLEKQLVEMKREYREKRTSALRSALEARKDIDATIRSELKTLDYQHVPAFITGGIGRYF